MAAYEKDRRPEAERQRQSDYEDVLMVMKSIAHKFVNSESFAIKASKNAEQSTTPKVWNSKVTSEVIKVILNRWGVDEDMYNITGEANITAKASRLILIEDLLEEFSVNDIMILLYYTFDLASYNEMMEGIIPEAIEAKYDELSKKLNVFVMGIISKFNIDDDILKILPDMSTYKFTTQDQIRILWYNRVIGMEVICKYGNLYSEEFTDYIIDHIVCKSENMDNENRKKDYLLNIYNLMNARYWMFHSEMFKEKHQNIFNQVAKIQISRTNSLKYKLATKEIDMESIS